MIRSVLADLIGALGMILAAPGVGLMLLAEWIDPSMPGDLSS